MHCAASNAGDDVNGLAPFLLRFSRVPIVDRFCRFRGKIVTQHWKGCLTQSSVLCKGAFTGDVAMYRSKQYFVELGGALGLYAILLVGANAVERAAQPIGALKLVINLIPMIGALAVAWAVLRRLWRMDEMQRRIQFDAIAISFLGTALITFGWGFAEGAGLPYLRAFAVWPIMGILWGLGMVLAQRRYR